MVSFPRAFSHEGSPARPGYNYLQRAPRRRGSIEVMRVHALVTAAALGTELSSEQRGYLEVIDGSVHQVVTLINDLLDQAKIDGNTRVKNLSEEEVSRIRNVIDQNFKVEGELRKEVSFNIKRLMDIGSYRGLRHRRSLPVRGQRTHTNARTRRGKKKTAVRAQKK